MPKTPGFTQQLVVSTRMKKAEYFRGHSPGVDIEYKCDLEILTEVVTVTRATGQRSRLCHPHTQVYEYKQPVYIITEQIIHFHSSGTIYNCYFVYRIHVYTEILITGTLKRDACFRSFHGWPAELWRYRGTEYIIRRKLIHFFDTPRFKSFFTLYLRSLLFFYNEIFLDTMFILTLPFFWW